MHMSDCLGGYKFLAEDIETELSEPVLVDHGEVTTSVFANPDTHILEINSKTGLYPLYMAYTTYRYARQRFIDKHTLARDLTREEEQAIWDEVVNRNIFVICKTKMARSITRRTLIGFRDKVSTNLHAYDDLLNQVQNKKAQFIKYVCSLSFWNYKSVKSNDMLKFNAIVGNPPYQEVIGGDGLNRALAKQLYPSFIKIAIEINPDFISLVTLSRWFKGDAQDKSFLELRTFIKEGNNHFARIFNFSSANDIFPNVAIKGGINYFLIDKQHVGNVDFCNCDNVYVVQNRPLFEEGLDIILNNSIEYSLIKKVTSYKFRTLNTITKGRNAFGIVGKPDVVRAISEPHKFEGSIKLQCKGGEIRWTLPQNVTRSHDVFKAYKVFISKSAGDPLTDGKIIGTPIVAYPMETCTDTFIPIGCFDDVTEAENLAKYLKTKFVRAMVSVLKVSQNVSQFVPLQDFTAQSDIDWSKSIEKIDKQLYKKYNLSSDEMDFIEKMIKPM